MKHRDIERMSDKQLKDTLRELNRQANFLVEDLKATGESRYSTALKSAKIVIGDKARFTVPHHATRQELYTRIDNARTFIRSPTVTPEGVKERRNKFTQLTGLSEQAYNRYAINFNSIKKRFRAQGFQISSDMIQDIISIAINVKDINKAYEEALRYYETGESEYIQPLSDFENEGSIYF